MFNKATRNVAAMLLAFGITLPGFTQKKGDDAIQNPTAPVGIKIDGNLSEWGNQFFTFEEETKLFYAVSNDSDHLYLAIKSENQQDLSKILAGGISFSVNIEGKKKEGASTTFPVLSRQRTQSRGAENALKERLLSAKEIRLNGFKQLPDGGISVTNDFGIKAAANLNDSSHFVYELAIPLKHLDLTASYAQPLAIQIKLNGISRPAPQNMNARMGGYGRWNGTPTPRNETEGFWIRRTLTNK